MTNLIAFQATIATTGAPQNLPDNPVVRSVTINAPATNSSAVVIGNVPDLTADTGFILDAGQSITLALPGGNTEALWAIGTAGDVFSIVGT